MRRLASLTLLVFAIAAPGAPAQGTSPFGPLPQPAPEETPVPTPPPTVEAQQQTDRTLLFVIGGALLALFVVIARVITRNAHQTLRETGRDVTPTPREQGPHRRARESKARARARAKAQRRARRQNR